MKTTKKHLEWTIVSQEATINSLEESVSNMRSEHNTLIDELIALREKERKAATVERQLVEFKTAYDKQVVELQNLREQLKQVTRDYHEQVQQEQNAQIASERLRRQRDAFRDALITVSDTTK